MAAAGDYLLFTPMNENSGVIAADEALILQRQVMSQYRNENGEWQFGSAYMNGANRLPSSLTM